MHGEAFKRECGRAHPFLLSILKIETPFTRAAAQMVRSSSTTMAPERLTRLNARAYPRIEITFHWFVEQPLRTNAFLGVLPRASETTMN
jgi:hypothetical protein